MTHWVDREKSIPRQEGISDKVRDGLQEVEVQLKTRGMRPYTKLK
jgi:hypothetical protein